MKESTEICPQQTTKRECRTAPIVWVLWLLVLAMAPADAQAELFGLPSGRLADISRQHPVSVEAGFVKGEFAKQDYSQPSVRINYRLAEDLMLFGDAGQSEVGKSASTTFGFGALYQVKNVFSFTESIALKGSVHQFEFDSSRLSSNCSGPSNVINPYDGSLSIDPGICSSSASSVNNKGKAIALEVLVSGNPISALKMQGYNSPSWYANAGFHTFDGVEIDSSFGFGGGLVLPLSNVEAYVGLDIIDEAILGIGVRYALR